MKEKILFVVIGVCTLGASLWWLNSRNATPAVRDAGQLVIAVGQGPSTLDPVKAVDTGSGGFLPILHAPLVVRGQNGDLKPILAESATMGADGLSCEIVLREGATFWGGSPVTSADVAYSFIRFYHSKHPFSWSMARIEGIAAALDDPHAKIAGLIESGDRKLEVRFAEPDPDFLKFIATSLNSVVRKGSAEQAALSFDTHVEGAGPFKPVRMDPGKSFSFERNLGFPIASNIKEVEVRIVENSQRQLELAARGEVDLVRLVGPMILEATDFSADGGVTVPKKPFADKMLKSSPVNEITFLLLNTRKGAFAAMTVEQRRAFSSELHRRAGGVEPIRRLYGPFATPTAGVAPRIQWEGPPGSQTRWEPTVAPIKARLMASNEPDARRLTALIQSHASEMGVEFAASYLDPAELVGKAIGGEADAFVFWIQVQPAHEAVPWFSFFDEAAFAVLGEAIPGTAEESGRIRGIEDELARQEAYRELIRRISSEQTSWVPLVSREAVYLVPRRLKGELLDWNGVAHFYEADFGEAQ